MERGSPGGCRRKRPMSVLRKHPLVVTLVAMLLAGCLTAGAAIYLLTKRHGAQLEEESRRHSEEIEKLRTQLRSIVRSAAGETVYLDVTRIPVSEDQLDAVAREARLLPDLGIYTRIPETPVWDYSVISEAEFLGLAVPAALADDSLSEVMQDMSLHLWRDPETYRLKTVEMARRAGVKEVRFFPYLVAQKLEHKALLEGLDSIELDEEKALQAECLTKLEGALDESGEEESAASRLEEDPVSATKMKILQALEALYQPQAISLTLTGLISSSYRLSQVLERSSFQIKTFQQKGNVLYVGTQLLVAQPELVGDVSGQRFSWNREYLFISGAREFVLIRISSPTIDGQGKGGRWAAEFLSRLYVPVSSPTVPF